MVFRRDNKSGDAFQRQMSALRQQLGDSPGDAAGEESDPVAGGVYSEYDESPDPDPQMATGLSGAVARADDYRTYGETNEGQRVTGSVNPVAPELPILQDVDADTTVIAFNTVWKGEITSEGTVHVHGRFEGAITAKDEIVVAERAEVDARLNATTVVVAGNMKGTIRCEGRFEVLPTGRVNGDVQSPTLVVHEGAVVAGQVRMNMSEPAVAVSEPAPRVERTETPVPVIQRRANRGSA